MGDPIKHRKKYRTPIHPWQKARIEEERLLIKEYGLKNKKEIWKMVSIQKKFARQAKSLIASTTEQGQKEKQQLMQRLSSMNILPKNADLDDVLGLSTRDIMERRLQTLVYRKGFAKTVKQARQFIVHGHIQVGGKKVTSPSYMVRADEEDSIGIMPSSTVSEILKEEEVIGK